MENSEGVEKKNGGQDRPGEESAKDLSDEEMSRIRQGLKAFEADHVWIIENWQSLLKKYEGRWIAVKNKRVIADHSHFNALLSKLDDPASTCIQFITREPLEMIL